MNVFVAIPALRTDIPEIPLFRLFVTLQAGYGCMGSFQREGRRIVFLKSVGRTLKTFCRMTLGAIRFYSPVGKLVLVVIQMAIGTSVMFEGSRIAGFMAGFAGYSKMLVFKNVTCFGMIKSVEGFNIPERFIGMATGTIISEFIFVRIFMAVFAGLILNALELLVFLTFF